MTVAALVDRVLAADPRAIARAISLIEDEAPAGAELIRGIFPRTGRAYLVGVTGPPGAGKSTLADKLTARLRAQGFAVGIIAVDPTSAFSGGAILGDRVRMQAHAGDPGVFIRSMATRGHLGGLARATSEVALVLDAAGKDIVLIETVGVGQDEIDIVRTADVSIVTVVPGTGDDVQALKAGIMEIADIFVVNKADREGADRTVASIEAMLALEPASGDAWRPPIIKTEATTGKGVVELLDAVTRFRTHTAAEQGSRRRTRAEYRMRELLAHRFVEHVRDLPRRRREPAERAARGHRADEDSGVERVGLHANAIAEHGPPGERAGGIDRHDPDHGVGRPQSCRQPIHHRRLARSRRAGDADHVAGARPSVHRLHDGRHRRRPVFDVRDEPREREPIAAQHALDEHRRIGDARSGVASHMNGGASGL